MIIVGSSLPTTTSTSSDGVVTVTTDPEWASVQVTVDWQAMSPLPWRTTVVRTNPNGSTVIVRSGDLMFTPGGDGFAYDHEAPLEGTISYQAFGYSAAGVLVQTSTLATLVLASASKVAWLKSLTNPSLSRRVSVTDWQESWRADVAVFDVPGATQNTAWQDTQKPGAGSLTVKVKTEAAYRGLVALQGSGTLLLQGSSVDNAFYGDTYFVAAELNPSRPRAMAGWGLRFHTLPVLPVDRPGTTGSPLRIPNWTNDIVLATYATYTAFDAAFATYVAQAKGP